MNKADRAEMEKLAEKFAEDVCECGCTNFVDSYKVGFQAGLSHEKKRAAKLVEALKFLHDNRIHDSRVAALCNEALAEYQKGGGDE